MAKYHEIPDYPEEYTVSSIITRLLDGLGFRFYWATEGLSEGDYSFTPGSGCRSIVELMGHIWGLMNWVTISVTGKTNKKPETAEEGRALILEMIYDLRNTLGAMNVEEIGKITIDGRPFWNIINGPISDALTHVGQINSFRRLAGNCVSSANVFTGKPPLD